MGREVNDPTRTVPPRGRGEAHDAGHVRLDQLPVQEDMVSDRVATSAPGLKRDRS